MSKILTYIRLVFVSHARLLQRLLIYSSAKNSSSKSKSTPWGAKRIRPVKKDSSSLAKPLRMSRRNYVRYRPLMKMRRNAEMK